MPEDIVSTESKKDYKTSDGGKSSSSSTSSTTSFYQPTVPTLFNDTSKVQHEDLQYILNPSKIKAPHVRAGNQLVIAAIDILKRIEIPDPKQSKIDKLKQGEIAKADSLIYRAMNEYGCSAAMKFIDMFSTLPGRCQLAYDLKELIKLHATAEKDALKAELQFYPLVAKNKNIHSDLDFIRHEFDSYIDYHIKAYKEAYSSFRFKYSDNFIEQVSRDDDFLATRRIKSSTQMAMRRRVEEFSAMGFIGYESSSPDDWYLKTQAQEDMEKSTPKIDAKK